MDSQRNIANIQLSPFPSQKKSSAFQTGVEHTRYPKVWLLSHRDVFHMLFDKAT